MMATQGTKSILEKNYVITEQVFRQVMVGEIPIRDIDRLLDKGYTIEEHKNLQRDDCLLLCGVLDNSAHHLVRSSCLSPLLVLWTYEPKWPEWITPVQRSGQGERSMSKKLKTCYFCSGALKEIVVGNYDFRLEGQLYVVKKVPATLCEQCGEKYLSTKVARKLSERVQTGNFSGVAQAYVMEFEDEQV